LRKPRVMHFVANVGNEPTARNDHDLSK
jgi:hypothetical protein